MIIRLYATRNLQHRNRLNYKIHGPCLTALPLTTHALLHTFTFHHNILVLMDSSALTGSARWRHNHKIIQSHPLFATGPPQPHLPTIKTTQLSFDEAQPCTPSKLLFVLEYTP